MPDLVVSSIHGKDIVNTNSGSGWIHKIEIKTSCQYCYFWMENVRKRERYISQLVPFKTFMILNYVRFTVLIFDILHKRYIHSNWRIIRQVGLCSCIHMLHLFSLSQPVISIFERFAEFQFSHGLQRYNKLL